MLKEDMTLEWDFLNMTYENVSQQKIQYHKGFVECMHVITDKSWSSREDNVFIVWIVHFFLQILILNCQAEEVILAYVHTVAGIAFS
jgi:hypothetical protein